MYSQDDPENNFFSGSHHNVDVIAHSRILTLRESLNNNRRP